MTRFGINALAPPPPSREMVQSAAFCALPAPTRALLVMIDIEFVSQGGLCAAMNIDDMIAATNMHQPDLIDAIGELRAAGFINVAMIGWLCIVGPSTRWQRR